MYYTVKTLLEQGKSQRFIAKSLGIHRKTVRRIKDEISSNVTPYDDRPRRKKLDVYADEIQALIDKGLSAVLIQRHFSDKGIEIRYSTLTDYLRPLHRGEVYVPVHSAPGEEAQVDFGYLGKFMRNGERVKVWVFSMILSHSRYSYQTLVTDQSVASFIHCHIAAFEYFGGTPKTVKLDNLKAGVITPSFFEPVMQEQYAAFLHYYGVAPVTARIARGQDKGKVESGIKYIKGNFLKGSATSSYPLLQQELLHWTDHICNQRLHGTTRKVPAEVFEGQEKATLGSLPATRFEIFHHENRKVNAYGHIYFRYNYYSVPYELCGKTLSVRFNGSLLKIYDGLTQVALHQISTEQGNYITQEAHKPPYKQAQSAEWYEQKASELGSEVRKFCDIFRDTKPYHWRRAMNGIFRLANQYSPAIVDAACKRAIAFNNINYLAVKNICKLGLYKNETTPEGLPTLGGFPCDLKKYDHFTSNNHYGSTQN